MLQIEVYFCTNSFTTIWFLQELGLSPSVPVHVVLQDWIRHSDGKLSFLGFVRLLHGVSSRTFQKAWKGSPDYIVCFLPSFILSLDLRLSRMDKMHSPLEIYLKKKPQYVFCVWSRGEMVAARQKKFLVMERRQFKACSKSQNLFLSFFEFILKTYIRPYFSPTLLVKNGDAVEV